MMKSHCGYVAVVGRPNVGKSTLVNCICGSKVSIVSPKPQTTRWQILGIKTQDYQQVIYIDTPGIHQDNKRAINRYMNRQAMGSLPDANIILFVIEAGEWTEEDESVLQKLQNYDVPIILVINKIDTLADKKTLLPFIDNMKTLHTYAHIIPISAARAENITELETTISTYIPEGNFLFPDEQVTDKNIRFQVAEIIREKVTLATEQEVPYCSSVEIEEWTEEENRLLIGAIIWVEREGQKLIMIGKKGERLKWIGTTARKDIELLLKQKIFLRLWVKIKEHWTDDDQALRHWGYSL